MAGKQEFQFDEEEITDRLNALYRLEENLVEAQTEDTDPAIYMNQDLRMADRLKAADQGNVFTVFGEPDVELRRLAENRLEVEIKGVDIYNPNTGELSSSSRVEDDVACWFLDTNYDGGSFFVRHAYFLGGKDPYEKLQKALKAEINEEAWETLHSAVSVPFGEPLSGKIAVKVINHFGDEVLKVFEVSEARRAAQGS